MRNFNLVLRFFLPIAFLLGACAHNPYRPDLPRLKGAIPESLYMRHRIIPVGNVVLPNRLLYYGQSYKLNELERVFYFTNSNSVIEPFQSSETWGDVGTVLYAGFLAGAAATAALMVIPTGTGFDSPYLIPVGIMSATLGVASGVSSYVAHHYRKKTVEQYNSWLAYNLNLTEPAPAAVEENSVPTENTSAPEAAPSAPAAAGSPAKKAKPAGDDEEATDEEESEEEDLEGRLKRRATPQLRWAYAVTPTLISGRMGPLATLWLQF